MCEKIYPLTAEQMAQEDDWTLEALSELREELLREKCKREAQEQPKEEQHG